MLHRLIASAVMLTTAFVLLLAGLRVQPVDALHGYFGDCAMPCWQTVQPGVTTRTDALARLKARGWQLRAECNPAVYDTCYDFSRGGGAVAFIYVAGEQVKQIALLRAGLSLGDVWLAFGASDTTAISPRTYRPAFLNMAVWFGSDGVSTRMRFPCPVSFAGLLLLRVDTLLVWSPDTAMSGDVYSNTGDLRQAIHAVCGL